MVCSLGTYQLGTNCSICEGGSYQSLHWIDGGGQLAYFTLRYATKSRKLIAMNSLYKMFMIATLYKSNVHCTCIHCTLLMYNGHHLGRGGAGEEDSLYT